MPRYRLLLEYDGSPFAGFQAQADQVSVQGCLEHAIRAFSGETVRIHVAGRTDAGVHATGQVAHFDLVRLWRPEVIRDALNAHLVPNPIAVLRADEVDPDFHARFSAVERRYLYRVFDRRAPAVLERGRVFWVKTPLDAAAMHAAAQLLLGHHDFTTFRDAQCQAASPMRTLDNAVVERVGEEIHLRFAARSFLHRQVRSLTGSLVEVGAARWTAEDLKEALDARSRTRCGPVAPAHGLYLTHVGFKTSAHKASFEDYGNSPPSSGAGFAQRLERRTPERNGASKSKCG